MFYSLAPFFHKKFVSVKVLDLCLVLQAQVRFRELASVEMEIGTDFERSYIVHTSDLPPPPAQHANYHQDDLTHLGSGILINLHL